MNASSLFRRFLLVKAIVKKTLIYALLFGALLAGVLLSCNQYVISKTKDFVFNDISNIPQNKVGLLLGTSKTLKSGRENLYYTYRIDAAVELYQKGKIEFVLVSGDNSRKDYDEPSEIKADLILRGVPENRIYLDYAGFRTLDSVVRCKEIFGQNSITIISQQFHNERAVCLAKHFDINAVAYNAENVSFRYGKKVIIREYFARTKMILDLVFGVEPKFLGEKIVIQ